MYGFTRPTLYALVFIPLGMFCALTALDRMVPGLSLLAWVALCAVAGVAIFALIFLVLFRSGLPPKALLSATHAVPKKDG
jgi:hypothetical protein